MSVNDPIAWLSPVIIAVALVLPIHAQQKPTIPESIAAGAVGSVATVPSGQPPSLADVLKVTDIIVSGTIGEATSYLSADQRAVYTDYPLLNASVAYQAEMIPSATPGVTAPITITQSGGTVIVNGTKFTESQPALPPLQPGTQGLFLLQHIGKKYVIARTFYGAFRVADGIVAPLMAREDFAPDFRNLAMSEALARIVAFKQAR